MKKLLCLFTVLCLLAGIGGAAFAEDDYAGEYIAFAVESNGYFIEPESAELPSVLTLNEDGTGKLEVMGQEVVLPAWSIEGETLYLSSEDGATEEVDFIDGIIVIDLFGGGDPLLHYAKEGTDVSGYDILSMEEFYNTMLSAFHPLMFDLYMSLDEAEVLHLNYDMHTDYMDSDQTYEVHVMDGQYYSSRTTHVSGLENTTITFIQDGVVYNLDPEDMTGIEVMDFPEGMDIRLMDDIFSALQTYSQRTEFTEEPAELDEVAYTAVKYPATEYEPEYTFYFDEDGQLVHILEGAPVIESLADMGETFYTINIIDDAVDASLFDMSGYEISDW